MKILGKGENFELQADEHLIVMSSDEASLVESSLRLGLQMFDRVDGYNSKKQRYKELADLFERIGFID